MTLKASMASDVTGIFLNTDDFAETITYYPRSGGSRSIIALIDRSPPETWDVGSTVTPVLTIHVHNNATTGIAHNEFDDGDQVLIAVKAGGTPEARTLKRVLDDVDGDMIEIAVF